MRLAHISARPGGVANQPGRRLGGVDGLDAFRCDADAARSKSQTGPAVRCTCQPCASSPPDANQPVLGTAGLWT